MFSLTLKSSNDKTGPIPVSTSTAATCPDDCPFKAGGCYAAGGPLAIHWRKVTSGERGDNWRAFCRSVAALPSGQLWRHNQSGDLPGNNRTINVGQLAALVSANLGKLGFTYTHKPLTKRNAAAIHAANQGGFTINLSANNLKHADELADANIGPVVAVVPSELARASHKENKATVWDESLADYKRRVAGLATPSGRAALPCPATYRDDINCANCGICQKQRKAIIVFPAHGAARRKASTIAEG